MAEQFTRDRERGIPVGTRSLESLAAEFGDRFTVERFDLPEQQEEGVFDSRPRLSDFVERVTAEDIANDQELIDLLTREREQRIASARESAGFTPDGTPPPARNEEPREPLINPEELLASLLSLQEVE